LDRTDSGLWHHFKSYIACKRAGRSDHFHLASGCAGRHGGQDQTRWTNDELAATALNVTLVAPVNSYPKIVTVSRTLPIVAVFSQMELDR
jgi:hypothetical protein